MIINTDIYTCYKCNKLYYYDTSKPCEDKYCEKCNGSLFFKGNADRDTELAEAVRNAKPQIKYTAPTSTPTKPTITCPYCKSTNTTKIGVVKRSVSFGLFGFGSGKVGKQWHCNSCKSDF